jgi:hypothetical protein
VSTWREKGSKAEHAPSAAGTPAGGGTPSVGSPMIKPQIKVT